MSEPNVPPPPSYTPPPPPIGTPPTGTVSPNRGIMLVLAYLGILAVVPLVVEKNDPEVQWHAKHGLVLFVAEVILWAILGVVIHIIPFLGCLAIMGFPLLGLAILLFHIFLIVKANNGQRVMIPGISEFADRF
jgi:fumarate reductase subunit D